MNSNYNDINASREIDLIDMFWYWLSHFKSLIVFLVIGIGVGVALFVTTPKATVDTSNATNATNDTKIEDLKPEDKTKASYASAEVEKPYPYKEEIDWNKRLSDSQRKKVDETVKLYNYYIELANNYRTSGESYKDNSEALYYLTGAKTNVNALIKGLSEDEMKYFYTQIGQDTVSDYYGDTVVANATKANTTAAKSSASKGRSGKVKFLISVIVALILHVLIFVIVYIFDKKLKYTENPSSMLGTTEFSRVINWESINSKGAITKAITKARLKREREIPYSEALEVNANAVLDISNKNDYKNILVVTEGLVSEGDEFKKLLMNDSDVNVSVVDNITHNALGAKMASEVEGCVILSKVGNTNLYDIFEEGVAVRSREIDLLGVIVYV